MADDCLIPLRECLKALIHSCLAVDAHHALDVQCDLHSGIIRAFGRLLFQLDGCHSIFQLFVPVRPVQLEQVQPQRNGDSAETGQTH